MYIEVDLFKSLSYNQTFHDTLDLSILKKKYLFNLFKREIVMPDFNESKKGKNNRIREITCFCNKE